MDRRIVLLLLNINNHNGNVEWNLKQAWAEIRLDISPAYAARLFKRCTGQGIREYAKKQRLQLAAERLVGTGTAIKIIAAESGYQLSRDFTRTFKGQYHQSPTEYRKKTAWVAVFTKKVLATTKGWPRTVRLLRGLAQPVP